MENQNYGDVIGCGSCAPFINNVLVPGGSTMSSYHSYGDNINGCSAGCYQAFTEGLQTVSDGWCPRSSSPCQSSSTPNIASQLQAAGLSTAMFCEDGCPRGADHFPWIGYANTWNSCVTGSFTCTGQTGPSGNILYDTTDALGGSTTYDSVQSNAGNSAFINYLNNANPANYIWFTPTDSHNMHDNSVQTGDNYLASLLVGSGGTLSNPKPGTILSTNLFKQSGTFLYIWWDEYDPSPNIEYGSTIKVGYTSTTSYTEYSSLHTIDANWGLSSITSAVSNDAPISDMFTTTSALSDSFTYSPASPTVGTSVSFTGSATGGSSPYSYSWNFGDGSIGSTANPSHAYLVTGSFTATLTATDSTGKQAKTSHAISISPPPSFTLLASQKNASVMQNFSRNVTLTTTSISGFTGTVTLTASVTGSGVIVKLSKTSVSLNSGVQLNTTLTIRTSNTTSLGTYTATVSAVSGSLFQSLTIPLRVTIIGDIDGNRVVNIDDLALIAISYGSTPTSAKWNPYADLNHDGKIDFPDLAIVASNFNKTS